MANTQTPKKRGHNSSINETQADISDLSDIEFTHVKRKAKKRRYQNTSQDKGIPTAPLMFVSILITCRERAKNIFAHMTQSFVNNEITQLLQGQHFWLETTPGNRGIIVKTIDNHLAANLLKQEYLRDIPVKIKALNQPKRVFGVVTGVEINKTTESILQSIVYNTKNRVKTTQALRLNNKDRTPSRSIRLAFDG